MERTRFRSITRTILVFGFLFSSTTKATPGPIPSLFDIPDNSLQAAGGFSGANEFNLGGDNGINLDAALSKSIAVEKNKGFVAPPVIEFKTTTPKPFVSPSPVPPPPPPPPPYIAPPPVRKPCKRDVDNAVVVQQNSTNANATDPNAQQMHHQQQPVAMMNHTEGMKSNNSNPSVIPMNNGQPPLDRPVSPRFSPMVV